MTQCRITKKICVPLNPKIGVFKFDFPVRKPSSKRGVIFGRLGLGQPVVYWLSGSCWSPDEAGPLSINGGDLQLQKGES